MADQRQNPPSDLHNQNPPSTPNPTPTPSKPKAKILDKSMFASVPSDPGICFFKRYYLEPRIELLAPWGLIGRDLTKSLTLPDQEHIGSPN
ncbi:hypothetical protein GBA52_010654 [Prunus armeniaca]|nr:hypothetical protein GBA52_010654 [Prunus armeniaca]